MTHIIDFSCLEEPDKCSNMPINTSHKSSLHKLKNSMNKECNKGICIGVSEKASYPLWKMKIIYYLLTVRTFQLFWRLS